MDSNEVPEKYKTCDWLWNYGSIGLTKEHIKRLKNAINILESLNEHTDAKYLTEIKDKLLEDTQKEETSASLNKEEFTRKVYEWLKGYAFVDDENKIHLPTLLHDFLKDSRTI